MTRSPATPDKSKQTSSKEVSKVAVPYLDKLTASAKGKQPSPQGPSPASTYGDTATGDSVPVTPLDVGGRDRVLNVVRSLRAAQLHDPDEPSVESPIVSRQAKRSAQSDLPADTAPVTFAKGSPSPTKTGSARHPAFNTVSAGSSPSDRRYKNILKSPSWRHPAFVHLNGQAEDPFTTSNDAPKSTAQQGGNRFLPREDRANLELTGDTAQALLPPNACVFVANLSSVRTDDQLEQSVSSAFAVFGKCYVKIRRDSHGMPFAFCQYENVADAQNAIEQGRGITIDNRPCRTERAKVNRSLYLSERSGRPISESEAIRLLHPHGEIEKIWYSSPTDKEMYRLPEGIWVRFAFFQDCRDAQAAFREHPRFQLEQPQLPSDIRRRANRPMQAGWSGTSPSPPSRVHQRARDSCTVYVGNLPPHVSRDRLEALFAQYGRVRNCELISKGSGGAQNVSVFAFIEFAAESHAGAVLVFDGVRLRIELKESADRRVSPVASSGSPRANVDGYGQKDPRVLVYEYAISLGFDPATAGPILVLGQGTPMTSSMYSPYSYYGSPYGYGHPYAGAADGTSGSPGMQGNAQNGTPQAMGHFQYPQGQVPYPHYQHYQPLSYTYQQHGMVNTTGPATDTTGNANGTEGAR